MSEDPKTLNSQRELAAWITDSLVRELRIDSKQVTLGKPFTSYGVDSMLATMLVGDLEEHLSRRLSPTLAWNHSSVEKLAEYLSQLAPETAEVANDTDSDLLARLEELSEEEIDRLLKERSERIPAQSEENQKSRVNKTGEAS